MAGRMCPLELLCNIQVFADHGSTEPIPFKGLARDSRIEAALLQVSKSRRGHSSTPLGSRKVRHGIFQDTLDRCNQQPLYGDRVAQST